MAKRPTDSQRSKLYASERVAFIDGKGGTFYTNGDFSDVTVAQAYCDEVLANPTVRDTFGRSACRKVEVYYWGRGGSADWSGTYIRLGSEVRSKPVLLHELAHMIAGRYYGVKLIASHGPQFAAVYLFLVRVMLGDRPADDLRASFDLHGVKFAKLWEPAVNV